MSKSTYIFVKPLEPLFFRTGKPFALGEQSWAASSLLPNSSVIWGAVFSKLLADHQSLFDKIKQKDFRDESLKEYLKIKQIYLYNIHEKKVLLPAPLDLFIDENNRIHCSDCIQNESDMTSCPLKELVVPEKEEVPEKELQNYKRLESCFIDINSLGQMYYKKYGNYLTVYDFNEIALADKKIGIKRNFQTRSSEEGGLYRIDLTQFKNNWGFLIDAEFGDEYSINTSGMMKLGGENKGVAYSVLPDFKDPLLEIEQYYKNKKADRYKLILTSSSVFDGECAWKPDTDNWEIIAASIGKSIPVGGFDIKRNRPKKMVNTVPAGSVYFFSVTDNEKPYFDASNNLLKEDYSYKGFNKGIVIPVLE